MKIQNAFISNPNYTTSQKMAYLTLCSYTEKVGGCILSKEVLANNLKISIKTVTKILNELEELGAIIIVNQISENNGKINNLYIVCDMDENTGYFIPESIYKFKNLSIDELKKIGLIIYAEITPIERYEYIKSNKEGFKGKGVGDKICEWCEVKTTVLNEHHYPIPKSKGGTDVVYICSNCHNEYHYFDYGAILNIDKTK